MSAQNALEKANKLYDLHAYRQAAQVYEKFFLTNDENGFATGERLADCYWQLNNIDKAIATYTPIVAADKASVTALKNYARPSQENHKY